MRARALALAVAAALAGACASLAASCRPRVALLRLLVRLTGADEAPARATALRALVPATVRSHYDLRYDEADADALLDVFAPGGAEAPLPIVVWVHGGGWIGGTKNDMREYLQLLAARGFVTVGVDYSHAPRRCYPEPIRQVNRALEYLTEHAAELGGDADRFVLAGDSAGAHIAAQVAAAISDASYASAAGLPAALRPAKLRACVLLCGMYDLTVPSPGGRAGTLADTLLWAYSGTRRHRTDPAFAFASVAKHVSESFPSSFLSVGNGDPLAPQTSRMAAALRERGVEVDELAFDGHQPPLPHEYHLDLPQQAAAEALERIVAHVDRCTKER